MLSAVFADTTQAATQEPNMFMQFLPLVAIFVIMYFLLIRPQKKRMKQQQEMVQTLKKGDHVMTSGGIFGTVSKVLSDSELELEIADGVRVKILKTMVSELTTPSVTTIEPKTESKPEAKKPVIKALPARRPIAKKPTTPSKK